MFKIQTYPLWQQNISPNIASSYNHLLSIHKLIGQRKIITSEWEVWLHNKFPAWLEWILDPKQIKYVVICMFEVQLLNPNGSIWRLTVILPFTKWVSILWYSLKLPILLKRFWLNWAILHLWQIVQGPIPSLHIFPSSNFLCVRFMIVINEFLQSITYIEHSESDAMLQVTWLLSFSQSDCFPSA